MYLSTARYRPRPYINGEEHRMSRLRSNWDPFDSIEKIWRDGEKARNGTSFNRSQERRSATEQIENGGLILKPASRASTDVVYLVQAADGGPVKIGHSTLKAVSKRLKALQTSHHQPLEIRALIDGGAWLEHALHELFDDYRIRGEWFAAHPLMQKLFPEVV